MRRYSVSQCVARLRTNYEGIARSSSLLLEAIGTAYDRIEAERDRNCWIYLRPRQEALEECHKLVARARTGENLPLLGIPFGVKDNIDVAGMPTTAACPAFSYTPARGAPVVEKLLAAGAMLVGKTNLDQFATRLTRSRSPYGAVESVFGGGLLARGGPPRAGPP